MLRKLLLLFVSLCILSCTIPPTSRDDVLFDWNGWPEENGLHFEAYYSKFLGHVRVWIYIKNISDSPITILTKLDSKEPTFLACKDLYEIDYSWYSYTENGIPIIESIIPFNPLELKPGETSRIVYISKNFDILAYSEKVIEYRIEDTLGKRHGIWYGVVECPIIPDKYRDDFSRLKLPE